MAVGKVWVNHVITHSLQRVRVMSVSFSPRFVLVLVLLDRARLSASSCTLQLIHLSAVADGE